MFFVEGGALAIENTLKTAFDWKVRKNLAQRQGREGHEDPPLQERLPRPLRLLALDDEHRRPAQDPVLPEVRLAALSCPKPRASRSPTRSSREVAAAEEQVEREIRAACAANPDDIAALIIEPIQGEGGDNHFRPGVLPPPARARPTSSTSC